MTERDVSQRFQTWLDKLEIRDVIERYMRFNDDRAAERIVELFHEDVRFQVMGRVLAGREAVRSMFSGPGSDAPAWTAPGELLKQPGSVHISSNPVIDVDGDTATAETDFLVVSRGDDGRAKAKLVGRYRDEFRRVDGRWLIYTRTGVSVARPGEAGADIEWAQALTRIDTAEKAQLRI